MIKQAVLRRLNGEVNQSLEDYYKELELDYEINMAYERRCTRDCLYEVQEQERKKSYDKMMELYWLYYG